MEPNNSAVFNINDEFFVGDQILVAPILDAGQSSRSIYLPPGSWWNEKTKKLYEGPTRIDFGASLNDIPYFLNNDENGFYKKYINAHSK